MSIWTFVGIVLILAIIIITIFIIRFLEGYRKSMKDTENLMQLVNNTFGDLDEFVYMFNEKMESLSKISEILNNNAIDINKIVSKFSSVSNIIEGTPDKVLAAVAMYLQLDKMTNKFNKKSIPFDKELDIMFSDFVKGAVLGGLVVAFLTPKTGKEMREIAVKKLDELKDKANNIDMDDVRSSVFSKIEELKEMVQNSNSEDIMKRVFEEIQKLYDKTKNFLTDTVEKTKDQINY